MVVYHLCSNLVTSYVFTSKDLTIDLINDCDSLFDNCQINGRVWPLAFNVDGTFVYGNTIEISRLKSP